MDGSNAAQPGQPPLPAQSLIRVEQIRKLPHLKEQEKQQHEAVIQRLWETINTHTPNSPEYQKSYARLGQISNSLMTGMRQYQAMRKQQQMAASQAQAIPHNAPNPASQGNSTATQFTQLNPMIQSRVNAIQFVFPPKMAEGTREADNWLREAKARFGQALQRSEMARSKKTEISRTVQQRTQAGNPFSPEEHEQLKGRIAQCDKAINESNTFMEKFKSQQNEFRQAQPQQRFSGQGQPVAGDGGEPAPIASVQPGPMAGPTAHSISSAVSAARSQASATQQAAMSPQIPQAQPSQAVNTANANPTSQQHAANTNQMVFNNQQPQADHIPPQGAPPQQHQVPGPPRSLSHQAAMAQSAQSYATQQQQPQSASHAHPPNLGYLNSAKKDEHQRITKNLVVTAPRPVIVPAARPSFSGGPGVGMPGQLAQPAIPVMPGYVLETSEDGRVLSKKKLNELVREVCGPATEDQLTPEVEEIFLQIADDFVDDLITAGCRLAKLRNASSLDIRDIQLILERQYNIRVPGFSSDELRTVRRAQPSPAYLQKMGAVQAAKLTGGGGTSAVGGGPNGVKDN